MQKTHCDGCDKVLTSQPFKSEPLQTKLSNGVDVAVELKIFHPVTLRSFELCAECGRKAIDGAEKPEKLHRYEIVGMANA